MQKLIESVLATREGGAVERCHTVPHLKEYNVAMHGYGCASLLLILHPDPPLYLIRAALWHDGGERWVGDTPAPAKWADITLDKALKELEHKATDRYGVGYSLDKKEDKIWLKCVDILDLYLWTFDQMALGNMVVAAVQIKCEDWFHNNREIIPDVCNSFIDTYTWKRLEELKIEN